MRAQTPYITSVPYLTFAAGVVVGLILGGFFATGLLRELPTLGERTSTPTTAVATSTLPASSAISVTDQGAGDTVIVDSVTIAPPGVWVAVREVRTAQKGERAFGYVLGAVRVGGPRISIAIPLLRETVPGRPYVIMLYRDDAGSAFDPAKNSVFVDTETGEPAIAYFKTTQ